MKTISARLASAFLFAGFAAPLFATIPQPIELSFCFGPSFLVGHMADTIVKTLDPEPTGLQGFNGMFRAAWYVLPNFGVEGLLRFGEIETSPGQYDNTKPVAVIDDASWDIGPVVQTIVPLNYDAYWAFTASGGFSGHSMDWDNSYTILFPGLPFAHLEPQLGFYGKVGAEIHGGIWYAGVSVMYERIPVTLSNGNDLSTDCWTVPIELGFAF